MKAGILVNKLIFVAIRKICAKRSIVIVKYYLLIENNLANKIITIKLELTLTIVQFFLFLTYFKFINFSKKFHFALNIA